MSLFSFNFINIYRSYRGNFNNNNHPVNNNFLNYSSSNVINQEDLKNTSENLNLNKNLLSTPSKFNQNVRVILTL